jgi:hypothetical protein
VHIVPIVLTACIALLKLHVMYCALYVGSCLMVIGCMVVSLPYDPCLDVLLLD